MKVETGRSRPGGGLEAPAPGAAERVVLTLPCRLVQLLTEAAAKKGLNRSAYIRMVLTDHLADHSMEEVDRQLYELAKRGDEALAEQTLTKPQPRPRVAGKTPAA